MILFALFASVSRSPSFISSSHSFKNPNAYVAAGNKHGSFLMRYTGVWEFLNLFWNTEKSAGSFLVEPGP